MLVLTRKQGERVVLVWTDGLHRGHKVVVSVNEIDRGKVKLGFEAEQNITIAREELLTEGHRRLGHAAKAG